MYICGSLSSSVAALEGLGLGEYNPSSSTVNDVYIITSTLLSRQNKRNLCYGPIQVTGVLRNFYCNF